MLLVIPALEDYCNFWVSLCDGKWRGLWNFWSDLRLGCGQDVKDQCFVALAPHLTLKHLSEAQRGNDWGCLGSSGSTAAILSLERGQRHSSELMAGRLIRCFVGFGNNPKPKPALLELLALGAVARCLNKKCWEDYESTPVHSLAEHLKICWC